MKILFTLIAALSFAYATQAGITLELDAGILQTVTASTALPQGSLLQLIATRAGASGTFSAPTPGSYVNGDNLVVASFAMNWSFGTGETDNPITFNLENTGTPSSSTFDQGDALLLRWYPTISLTQFNSGTKPTAGTPYGQFHSDTGEGGGIAWFAPSDGTTLAVPNGLNFLTTSAGGSHSNSTGVASLVVQAVPEPSTYALVVVGSFACAWLGRRRKSIAA